MVNRLSFADTAGWRDRIGFVVNIGIQFRSSGEGIAVRKGGLVYGFRRDAQSPSYGYVVENDVILPVRAGAGNANTVDYVTMDLDGHIRVENGNFNNVRGMAGGPATIPWYTFNGRALIGKVFKRNDGGIPAMVVVCDDPYWCEFEGDF